ncbi:MAG: VWA domain-containing protein [Verrucomicrobiota bacterium]
MKIDFENPWMWAMAITLPLVLLVLRFTLVDNPKVQLVLSALTRCLILLLLTLALTSLLWVSKSDSLSVLVLADLSGSVSETAPNQASNLWTQIQSRVSARKKVGLITFASTNQILAAIGAKTKSDFVLKKFPQANETAIERALISAWESMPADSINRVVIISDGNETAGNAIAAAKRAASHGLKIYGIPYQTDPKDEVLLEDLIVPSEVKKGQSFSVSAVAHSTTESAATFTLFRDGFKIQDKEIQLKPGANTLAFQETKAKEGLIKYELRMKAAKDFFADNNVASGIVHVSGEPRVLLLEGNEREGRFLGRALEAENIRVEVREGKGMPGNLEELAAYDAIIFSDVPATDMTVRQMNLLRSYVEDLGGGFLMIGGQESFGLGGYYRTSIEDALPVRMRSEKKKDTPSLAMMLVIDKSGSMEGDKIQFAKEAAIAAVEVLSDRDYVGVIAFDGDPYVIADLQSAANKAGILQSIERIDAGGGTAMYEPMVKAHQALQGITAGFKHCIVLTDGVSQPGDFQGITGQMGSDQITVSTVAVGQDIDADLLQSIARWGKGRYYQTTDAHDIPQIFTKETMSASKSSLVEEPFLPQVFRDEQIIRGIDWKNAPFLFGYVVTSPKPTANVSLLTERGDPLFASWRFGLGKAAAFTSDAKSRWAADWVRWPGYGQFWAQVIRDIMRTTQSRGAETTIAMKGDQGRMTIDNTDENGQFVNDLKTTAQLVKPDLSIETIALRQSAPGRYEASFPMTDVGSYLFKVRQSKVDESGGEEVLSDYTRALTVSYKPEYRHLSLNENFLRELSTVTGGKYNPSLDEVFQVSKGESVPVRKRLWPWLLSLALLLFIVDVALRRMDLTGNRFIKTTPQRYG